MDLNTMHAYAKSEEGATAIAAGLITTAAATAVGYVGGKSAIATACVVGGGLFALATTFAVAQLGVKSAVRGYAYIAQRMEKRPRPMQDERRAAQAS